MFVSKEEAKKRIDEAPGMIWMDSFNGVTYIHTRPTTAIRTQSHKILRFNKETCCELDITILQKLITIVYA